MLRTFDLILIAAMLVAATVTYKIKYDSEKQIVVINKLKRQIASEKDTITLLRADWSLMTQPGRLQNLVDVYAKELSLQNIDAKQIVQFNEIPNRPVDEIEKLISGSDALIANNMTGIDRMATGSVNPAKAGQ
ncbi:hypothetical protein ACI0FM_01850 [Paenochrobactrum sp. BZR 588]|uniref:cell division protein FtsL n=1 Tax=Paenochrobactrum TaxID=999488 RepID=UPI0035BC7B4B